MGFVDEIYRMARKKPTLGKKLANTTWKGVKVKLSSKGKAKRTAFKVKHINVRKSIHADRVRHAKPYGYRKSASGKRYFENRNNRADERKTWL